MADRPRYSLWPAFYWFRFDGFPVTMPAMPKTKHFRWQRLCGIQIGSWFFGAIKGGPGEAWTLPETSNTGEGGHAS